MKFSSYKNQSLDQTWDAIVVGSGMGGLATAALLSSYAAKRVLVLERHYVAGGYTHAFHRPGYEWDVGLHYIGDVQDEHSMGRRAFDQITDGQLKWAAMPDVYERFVIGDRNYEFVSGVESFRARMKEYFPQESAAIDHYIRAVQAVHRATAPFFAEKAIPRPIAYLLGGLMRALFLRWANRTTAEVLRGFTGNNELIGVLAAQWGDYGLPPGQSSFGLHAMIANHYFEGASYPVGGASRIAETVAPVIERSGGRIVVNAEVAEILQDDKRAIGVRMADGREFRAGTIISDSGARNTFDRLILGTDRALEKVRAEIHSIPPSTAHLCLYVGSGIRLPTSVSPAPTYGFTRPTITMPTPREPPRTRRHNLLRSISPSPQPKIRILSDVILAVPPSKWLHWCRTIGSSAGRIPGGSGADRITRRSNRNSPFGSNWNSSIMSLRSPERSTTQNCRPRS